jgi:hypothetical protein
MAETCSDGESHGQNENDYHGCFDSRGHAFSFHSPVAWDKFLIPVRKFAFVTGREKFDAALLQQNHCA